MHVSNEYRHKGIGKKLFAFSVAAAKKLGAEKMYISTHSSQESQVFYRAMGCVHAEEIVPELVEAEPFDIQLEYVLSEKERVV